MIRPTTLERYDANAAESTVITQGGYQTTFIEYDDDEDEWACCGNAPGCNGTVTSTTFTAVSPEQWSRADSSDISGSSSTSSQTSTSAPASQGTVASSTVSIATSQTVSTLSATSSASSSSVEQEGISSGSSGLGTGAKAGIGVACAVAGLALIAAVVALVLWRKSTRRKRAQATSLEMKKEEGRLSAPPPYPPPVEAGGETMKFEMPAQRTPAHELPSSGM